MTVAEDIKNKQNQSTQAETAAEREKILNAIKKRNEELAKRQKEAKRMLESKKAIYDLYITQLSTGKSKGKKLSDFKLEQIRKAAEDINKELADLRKLIAQKPEVVKLPTAPKPQAAKPTAGPTGTVTLQATKTADQTAKDEADAAAGKKTPGGKGKGTVTGTMPNMPSGGKPGTGVVGAGFDPGRFRMGEEASMGAAMPTDVGGAITGKRTLEQILGDVGNYFDIPDYIFKMDTELSDLLVRAVNEKWTTKRWGDELELTNWYRKNNKDVRGRLTSFGNYEDLRSQGQNVDKSDYGLWLRKKRGQLKADAQALAGVAITDAQADEIAQKIYLGFLDDDENAIRSFLVPFIGKTTSIVGGKTITGYSGQALKDFQTLQSIAKANGLALKDILPGISATTTGGDLEEAVLEKIALGELDVNRISQDARMMAAIGQPEFVRGLLNQGYDLDQVYSPYKNVMARVLDLNPEEIDLNDPTLRSAITDKGETNLYDFQRGLRKDSRWQYTEGAREEVANSVLGVLRDFGFQG
jgi:hypothetical protein